MRKLSRRQKEIRQKIQDTPYLDIEKAIENLKTTATAKFIESVEIHANLNKIAKTL